MSTIQVPASDKDETQRKYDKAIARGALINLLGLSAKLINPLTLLLIPWLFGTDILGIYILAIFINDIVTVAVTSGLVDAATLFASRHVEGAKKDPAEAKAINRVMANAFTVSIGVSLVLFLAVYFGAELFVKTIYPEHPELVSPLRILAGGLPAAAFSRISIAGTKAYLRMEYDAAILGFFQPFTLLTIAVLVKLTGGGLNGLMTAQLSAYWVGAVLSLWALSRHFSLPGLFAAIKTFRFEREIISFAIPQSINMTFNRYATRLDVIMLGAYGASAKMLGLYGIASLITNEMRQAKLVFSSALAPVTARYHAADQRKELEAVFNRVSRWTTSIIVPLAFVVVVMRDDVLHLIDATYTGDTRFMALLLVAPIFSCAFGLAGNCITYTGHSRWTLFNSLVVSSLTTGFNLIFIPRFGLLGAALSAVLASTFFSALELAELGVLERIYLRPGQVYHPYAAFSIAAIILFVLWDPSQLPSLWIRAAVAIGFVALTIGVMASVGHPELKPWILRRFRFSSS